MLFVSCMFFNPPLLLLKTASQAFSNKNDTEFSLAITASFPQLTSLWHHSEGK